MAKLLDVDVHFVTRAIQEDKLKAEKRHTKRTEKQGGDIWFIKTGSAREYIEGYVEEIDFRCINKRWLVDLLTGFYE